MVIEQGARPASLQTKVTPGGSEAKGPLQFGMCGAEIGCAARDEQGKATRSDVDVDDAQSRFTAGIEIRHAIVGRCHTDAAPVFSRGGSGLSFDGENSSDGKLALGDTRMGSPERLARKYANI
jgi:hypothetical protein